MLCSSNAAVLQCLSKGAIHAVYEVILHHSLEGLRKVGVDTGYYGKRKQEKRCTSCKHNISKFVEKDGHRCILAE